MKVESNGVAKARTECRYNATTKWGISLSHGKKKKSRETLCLGSRTHFSFSSIDMNRASFWKYCARKLISISLWLAPSTNHGSTILLDASYRACSQKARENTFGSANVMSRRNRFGLAKKKTQKRAVFAQVGPPT